MSAPTPATGDGSPAAGFYPDPSIPGYVRYWSGVAWVPGTSRPAPGNGAPLPTPPSGEPTAPSAAGTASPQAPGPASLEETGPVFLDEDPAGGEPVSVWQADASQQSGFGGDRDRRVSWGTAAQDPRRDAAGAVGTPAASPEGPSAPSPAEAWSPAAAREARAAAAAGAAVPPRARFDRPVEPAAEGAAPDSAVDPSGGALPGMRSVGGDAGGGEGSVPFPDGTTKLRAQQPKGDTAPAEGTMTIRTMTPQQPGQPTRQGAEPRPQQPVSAAQTAQSAAQGPAAAPERPQARQPAPDRSQTQAPAQVPPQQQVPPVSAGEGGGAASWAQQVHQLAQVQDPQEAERQPVTPWKPPVSDPFLQAAQAQASARPAALGKRVVARLIDTAVLGAVVGAVAYPLVSRALTHIDEKIEEARLSGETVTVYLVDATTSLMFGLALVALLLLGTLYEALPTAKWGRTLGKKLMGLDVRHIETHESPDFMAALVRWLVHGVLGVLLIGVVNVLWCVFDRPWRQCWHDKMAHTFVAGSPD
ncbi:RDD family protein [Streptomyces sp. SCSIO 30461]|uniref:RDD family protein n=1 Tax=Streptomyces sp. SCSIO 30461 TaxID=3118085 RepID=UPI0030CA7EDF